MLNSKIFVEFERLVRKGYAIDDIVVWSTAYSKLIYFSFVLISILSELVMFLCHFAHLMQERHNSLSIFQENAFNNSKIHSKIIIQKSNNNQKIQKSMLNERHKVPSICHYASPSSGEAYRDRRLTTNFEL